MCDVKRGEAALREGGNRMDEQQLETIRRKLHEAYDKGDWNTVLEMSSLVDEATLQIARAEPHTEGKAG